MKTVYIPGCWDLLHIGHVLVLEAAKKLGDMLIVGVAGDETILSDKGRYPIIRQDQRLYMVSSLKCVDSASIYRSLNFIPHLVHYQPDILAVGEQWGTEKRHKDAEKWMAEYHRSIVRLPYTKGISTSEIIKRVKERK